MAFGNGVLMRSVRFWAWARDDGSVLDGPVLSLLDRYPLLRWPLVRSLVAFAEMVVFAVRLHRRNGRRPNGRLLAWLGLCLVAGACLDEAAGGLGAAGLPGELAVDIASVALALAALRLGMGRDVWRYHGAEHKAVNAYEAGADLSDLDAVGRFSRVHDRCGTNLTVIIVALSLAYLPFGAGSVGEALGIAYGLLAVAVSLELFRLVTRRPQLLACRAVLLPGRALQRCCTTRDPRRDQLALACLALGRVVALERGMAVPQIAGVGADDV